MELFYQKLTSIAILGASAVMGIACVNIQKISAERKYGARVVIGASSALSCAALVFCSKDAIPIELPITYATTTMLQIALDGNETTAGTCSLFLTMLTGLVLFW